MSVTDVSNSGHAAQSLGQASAKGDQKLSPFIFLFLLSLIIPLFIYAGPVRLSVYRIVLLVSFIPALTFLLSGKAGRIILPDICVMVICVWSTISLIVHHGVGPMVEPVGILVLETMGAYLLGRCYVRSPEDLLAVVRVLFGICLLLAPFALIELLTDRNILLEIARKIGPAVGEARTEKRFGLNRVHGPFDHPILFGVLFGGLIGMIYFILGYGRAWVMRTGKTLFVAIIAALALSTGPLIALTTQLYFLLWNGAMKKVRSRWKILTALGILGYIVVDLVSNRTPFHVLVTYLSLSSGSAYARILIWQFGTDNIFNNPILGIGLNDWVRPAWMGSSVDMFWIVNAMKHGIVVWAAYLTLFGYTFLAIARLQNLSEKMEIYRLGFLSSMFGLFMAGWTVHFWNALFVYFMFLLASGIWFLDYKEDAQKDASEESEGQERRQRYTRFEAKTRP